MRLANELRKDEFKVTQIHHFVSFSFDELEKIIFQFASAGGKIVGISTSFLSSLIERMEDDSAKTKIGNAWDDDQRIFKKLLFLCVVSKKYKCSVVIGGWEIAQHKFLTEELRNRWGLKQLLPFVDYFVIGNGASVLRNLALGQKITINKDKIAMSDPIFDYSDVSSAPEPQDHIMKGESLSFEIAAGCVFSCHFCGYGTLGKKKTEYMRDYESLKRELVSNYENFNTTVYDITDNIINDYHEKVIFLRRIRDETGIDFRWNGYVRLDTIKNKEQADALRESGMSGALMGIESFKTSTGKYIGKMTDGERLKDILHMCRESWQDTALVSASFIAGLPTETEEDITNTYNWLISPDGRNLIDTFKFNLLFVNKSNDDKNDINKNRNSPFKDYDVVDVNDWTSPWSSSECMLKLSKQMNENNINHHGIHSQSLTIYANYGFSIEDLVMTVRKRKPFNFKKSSKDNLNEYTKWVMKDLPNMF